jgi:putative hydrolase of the HAD superfamily
LEPVARTAAVFFDVDFTLIHPGPRFQGAGYQASCARYGIAVDADCFDAAVAGASSVLVSAEQAYDENMFVAYTRRIIELMGGEGDRIDDVAREMYREWAEHQHFRLYDDVPGALRALDADGVRIGLISNSHRCLVSFQTHFELEGLISAAVSSSEHGYMKPHPSIFRAALELMQVEAGAAVMVGDSFVHDIVGARQVGMRGVLLARGGTAGADDAPDAGVPVIRTLAELPALL